MIARDLLELDDEQFERRLDAVKRRMPQPPGIRLQAYVRDFADTVPTDHAPLAPAPAHAASEIDDDFDTTGDGVMAGRLLIFAALAAAVIGVLVMLS